MKDELRIKDELGGIIIEEVFGLKPKTKTKNRNQNYLIDNDSKE